MEIAVPILLLILGLALTIKGGDFFVDAASWMAEVSGIPKLIVGATVVSLATTLPELLVSTMAAAKGSVDMAAGNAIGSVTANLGLILAIGIICIPAVIERKDYMLKTMLMLGGAILIVASGSFGSVGIGVSIALLVIFAVAMYDNVHSAVVAVKGGTKETPNPEMKTKKTVVVNIIKFILGAAGIVWGADLMVDNGSLIAQFFGVSERIISVTIIAIGTSLPELVTTITAIVKKQSSLSVGNIIGANIIDLTLILPVCSLVSGQALPITANVARIDFPACLIIGGLAVIPTLITKKFSRVQGIILMAAYVAYVIITCMA